jgi:hypothetical protein
MRGAHRVYYDVVNSWLPAYVVAGIHFCVCLTYAVVTR